jgi:iron complex outermembrane receptor protein
MDLQFMVNVPLSNTLFMRMSGVTRNNDGYSRRLIDGVKLGDDHDVGGRLQFRWVPSADFEALLSIDGSQRRAHIAAASAVKVIPSFASDTFKLRTGLDVMDYPVVANGWEVSTTGVRPTDDMNVFGASLHLDWNMGSTHLKSITAYRRLTEETAADFDGTALQYNDQLVGEHQKQFSQEFQLTHKTDSFNGILGVYYMHESNPETVVSYYTGFYANVPYGTGVNQTEAVTDDSYSAYGQGTYNFTKELSLTGGLRVTYEKRHVTVSGEQGALPIAWVLDGEKSWSDVSPHIGVNYQATPDLMLYASLTEGFKSGSYNARPGGNATYLPYDPERVWSNEVGFKSQWLDNKVRLNAAAFLTHYHAIQLLTLSLDQNGFLYFPVNNAGDLNIKGFEVELQARPVQALNLYANLGHASESWSKIYTPEDDPRILFPIVASNTRLPSLSHWTLNAGADLTIPLANFGTATLGGNYSYRSSYFFDTGNGPLSEQKSFGLIDGYFIVAPEGDNWQIKLWGKNLANKHYMTFAQDALAYDSHAVAWWGRPREFGVSFRVSM